MWVEDHSHPPLKNTLELEQEIIENFKKFRYKSYLSSLREHSRNLYQTNLEYDIKVGDFALTEALMKPRPFR